PECEEDLPSRSGTWRAFRYRACGGSSSIGGHSDKNLRRLSLPCVCRFGDEKWSDGQTVHVGTQEAVERLRGCIHDRLVFVERGIDQNRDATQLAESLQQLPIEWAHVSFDGLQAARAVLMRHRGNQVALVRLDLVGLHHKRGRV